MLRTVRAPNQSGLRNGHNHHQQQQHSNYNQQQAQPTPIQQQTSPQAARHHQNSASAADRKRRKDYLVRPTQFLLGGNVNDPLNLAALTNLPESEQRTPINSPLPTPQHKKEIEVLIPADLDDPLRLNQPVDESEEGGDVSSRCPLLLCRPLTSPIKFNNRNKRKRRRCDSDGAMLEALFYRKSSLMDSSKLDLTPRKRSRCTPPKIGEESNKRNLMDSSPQFPFTRSAAARANASSSRPPMLRKLNFSPIMKNPSMTSSCDVQHARPRAFTVSTANPTQLVAPVFSLDQSSDSDKNETTKQNVAAVSCSNACSTLDAITTTTTVANTSQTFINSTAVPATTTVENSNNSNASSVDNRESSSVQIKANESQPGRKNHRQEKRFPYGNYNRYYGYRNATQQTADPRMKVLKREWFENGQVLDIGCNAGHLTLNIARDCRPTRILGVDIDAQLIRSAKSNIRNYLSGAKCQAVLESPSEENSPQLALNMCNDQSNLSVSLLSNQVPLRAQTSSNCAVLSSTSMVDDAQSPERSSVLTDSPKMNFASDLGTVDQHNNSSSSPPSSSFNDVSLPDKSTINSLSDSRSSSVVVSSNNVFFPLNVRFFSTNYVLSSDELLSQQQPEYDVILCMSVTKWVHLNWGDDGLRRLFKRVYRQLRPGGRFILEPQPWASYSRRKALSVSFQSIFYLFSHSKSFSHLNFHYQVVHRIN